ncbi:MAG: indole-3-glycerol phosphate synthase TrpC [Acidobacteria bacterium]|nr:indole-3-glycerol phosphate synthase TrpC [Acidobacteriota bacterium]MBV9477039.1 indole-3-glycerol phosphate synthase TrpC [Acidobacteriota bacterium]
MTVLDQIVERTRERLRTESKPDRRAAEDVAASRAPFAFREALARDGVNVIAEIKSASPSAGSIIDNPDVEAIAREYARGGAAALSVVTEPEFFRGSREWLARASGAAALPVVMKDFVVEPSQIVRGIAAGANAILLLASLLDTARIRDFVALLEAYGCDALVEVHDEEELERAVAGSARIIGVNNRDLRDFRVDLATSERLGARMPADAIRVAESGIRTHADVARLRNVGFHAFLVGESLLRQHDRAAAVRALIEP